MSDYPPREEDWRGEDGDPLESWELDQAQASIRDIAPLLYRAYCELRSQGMPHKESCDLTAAWIAACRE